MLIQFNFRNHKSYLNEICLDFKATAYHEHESNLIIYKKDEKYLKVMAIYGANESGKSNVIDAFKTMQYWVKNSFAMAEQIEKIPLKKYMFTQNEQPALYELFFSTAEAEYQYGFEATDKSIIKEWLYKRDFRFKEKYSTVFERLNQKIITSKKLEPTKTLLKSINEKTLALTLLSNLGYEDTKVAFNWISITYAIDFGDAGSNYNLDRLLPDIAGAETKERELLREYLNAIGSSVKDLELKKVDGPSEVSSENNMYKAFSMHKNKTSEKVFKLPLSEESSGTRKMITMFSFLTDALTNGKVLFIDEMDAKLHPLLTRYIINLFHREETNAKGAQLIFTTHDTNTLNNDLFRRDQLWFAEKNEEGISELFSLADFKVNNVKVRNDATYNKDYLGGRYGAIPHLNDLRVNDNE